MIHYDLSIKYEDVHYIEQCNYKHGGYISFFRFPTKPVPMSCTVAIFKVKPKQK